MAVLDGATYLRRQLPLSGVASSKKAILSGWFHCANGEGGVFLVGGAGATAYIKCDLSTSTGFITFQVANSAGTTLWSITSSTAYDDDAIHHFAVSMDLGSALGQFYVDGDSAAVTTNQALTDGTVAYASATEWLVGADLSAATPFTGSLYSVDFWPGFSLDLSTNADLQQIVAIDEDQGLKTDPQRAKPVGPGVGEVPAIAAAAGFQRNLGNGGVMVLTGAPDEDVDPDSPSAWRLFPRWRTPGERWFLSELSGTPYPRSQTFIEQREGLTTFGKRHGIEEMDSTTRRERPGFNFTDLVLGLDDEDDDEDFFR